MVIIHNFTMALNRRGITPVVDAVQGDSFTRKLAVDLAENGEAWPVPSGVTAGVAFRKPDGHRGLYDRLPDGSSAVTVYSNTVTAVLAPEVLSCAGDVWAAIVLHDENLAQLATFPVCIRVAANPASGAETSNDYYNYSTMEEVSEAVEEALKQLEADKKAFLAEAEKALEVVHDTATENAPAIVCEKTGSIITADDASNRLLQGLNLYGKTTQNGTPTPESPVPLENVGNSGSVGVTVFGRNWFALAEPGSVDASGNESTSDNSARRTPYIKVVAGEKYTFSKAFAFTNSNENGMLRFFNKDKSYIGSATALAYNATSNTYTIPMGVEHMRFVQFGYGRYTDANLQIEKGDTVTEYDGSSQPLTAQTPNGLPGIPVSSGGNYTDENGQQWICDEVDFGRGVYVQRVICERFTSNSTWWTQSNSVASRFNINRQMKTNVVPISTHFIGTPDIAYNSGTISNNIGTQLNFGTAFTTLEEWLAWLDANEVYVLYAIAEEKHIAMTAEEIAQYSALHTNYPNTTIYNDAGAHMEVKYVADTQLYVDKKIKEFAESELSMDEIVRDVLAALPVYDGEVVV